MRVLGVDPGLGRTGVAVVEGSPGSLSLVHSECLETVPQTADSVRLASLMELVGGCAATFRPDVAAVELLFFSTNRRTAMRVGEARGVILCALARQGVQVIEYTPTQVKEAVTGNGSAPKQQLSRMTRTLLGAALAPTQDDAADACAIAICHHHRAGLTATLDVRLGRMPSRAQRGRAAPPAPSRLEQAMARGRRQLDRAGL